MRNTNLMAAYPSRPRNPSVDEVTDALQDVDFPMSKEELVAFVERQSSEPAAAVARQNRALPLATYESLDEVLRSIDVADQMGY